jgi:hypothetical protein
MTTQRTDGLKITKYFTYDLLKRINTNSIRARRNQNLVFNKLPIEPSELYPVVYSFPHNDVEIRALILLNRDGQRALLDMSFEEFDSLPSIDMEEDDGI